MIMLVMISAAMALLLLSAALVEMLWRVADDWLTKRASRRRDEAPGVERSQAL